jgi:hypothetical protein
MQCKKKTTKFDVLSLQKVSELTIIKLVLSYNTNCKNFSIYNGIPVQNFT